MSNLETRIFAICSSGWVLIWDLWSALEDEAKSPEISIACHQLHRDGKLERESTAEGWQFRSAFRGVNIDAAHRSAA